MCPAAVIFGIHSLLFQPRGGWGAGNGQQQHLQCHPLVTGTEALCKFPSKK